MGNGKIDFVITWVDGNDPAWRKEATEYERIYKEKSDFSAMGSGADESRVRDWDNLQYLFRGIEKFAPWVNRIHFVSWGHLPKWLNKDHPKLNIVTHKDYIPADYLPTFNSAAIELNLHRINGLEENFVKFDDDMFLLNALEPTDFFRNGLPCQSAILDAATISGGDVTALYHIFELRPINRNFKKKEVLRKNLSKWFTPIYGRLLIKNILLYPFDNFTGFFEMHMPNAYRKSVYEDVWNKEFDTLDKVSKHKFRELEDVNAWFIEHWQLVTGEFVPRSPRIGRSVILGNNVDEVCDMIKNRRCRIYCINDSKYITDFETTKNKINKAFESVFPEKSTFEL